MEDTEKKNEQPEQEHICDVSGIKIPSQSTQEKATVESIQAVARSIVKVAADLLYEDRHVFGSRPCATCKTISQLLDFDFGCVRFAKERSQKQYYGS